MKTPEEIQELMKRQSKLFIERLPADVREEFTAWAKERFCDDYGMALAFLWRLYTPMRDGFQMEFHKIDTRLAEMEARVQKLESPAPSENEKKTIRMCDGTTVEVEKNG